MKKRIVLVSGMSGAGKSSATSILEDIGYHMIENYPVQLLSELVEMIEHSTNANYNYVALSVPLADFPEFLRIFSGSELNVSVLLLDATDTVLLQRYKSTRRNHPFIVGNISSSLEDAIEDERQLFLKVSEMASFLIDTTYLKNSDLKAKLEGFFAKSSRPSFSISFVSFGFKHGVPRDADCMFDVRFLPNPYWDEELRPYSGDDKCVYDYVMEKKDTKEFIEKITTFLDYAFEKYVQEGKNHFTVAIGCTGGQHRSVSITNYLYDHYHARYTCFKEHRDKVGFNRE